ncbi:MAG: ABC transporter permease [Thermaceae bacterium]|nr:ABC transporter permease [Thermaceae bacterium]
MRPADYLYIAYHAIQANPLRSVLTTLGVIIGVGSVVTLVSLGQGAGAQIARQIQGLGSNTIVVSTQIPPNGGTSNPNNQGGPPQMFPDDANALRDGLASAALVVPEQSAQVPVSLGSNKVNAQVIGTWSTWAAARGLKMSAGTFLPLAADSNSLNVVVLGSDVAYELFGRLEPLDRYVLINKYRYRVIGVVAPTGFQNFQNVDKFVYVPFLMTQNQILGTDVVNHIYVQAPLAASIPQLEKKVTDLMASQHGIQNPSQYDFTVRSQSEVLSIARSTLNTVTSLLSSIAAISLVVGGIGIMNIMLVSVTERTREVGIRLALGALPGEIVVQFIAEAILLSSLGGVLGILLGAGFALLLSATAGWQTVISPAVVFIAFLFSLVVGVFFGWYPAFKASRLDPIQALRYE